MKELERKGENVEKRGNPGARQEATAQVEINHGNSTIIVPKPVSLLLTYLNWLLFGTRRQGGLAGQYGNDEHTQEKWTQKIPDHKW